MPRLPHSGWRVATGALLGLLALAGPAAAVASSPATHPRAWILVDADRGVVLDAGNDRQPLPPASLTKLLTAEIAVGQLAPTDTLTVSARAAAEPASKLNMQPGQVWTFDDALHALLLSSANDAAVAIGERVAGSLERFSAAMQAAATELGLQDQPVLRDPAGLDDGFAVNGGNLLSARDLAIIARDALGQPLIAQVVATPVYRFVGPDGTHHRLGNHNQLLRTYPGAIGMKTGYTAKAGENLIAAAHRGTRTMIAVVMGAPNLYRDATALLDEGFASSPSSPGTGDRLPVPTLPDAAVLGPSAPLPAQAGPSVETAQPSTVDTAHRDAGPNRAMLVLGIVLLAGTIATGMRRRQVMRRRTWRHRKTR